MAQSHPANISLYFAEDWQLNLNEQVWHVKNGYYDDPASPNPVPESGNPELEKPTEGEK